MSSVVPLLRLSGQCEQVVWTILCEAEQACAYSCVRFFLPIGGTVQIEATMLRFASQNITSGAPVEYEQKLREIHESGELMERTCFGHKDCFSYSAKGGVSSSTQSQLIAREETQNAGQKQTWLWIDGYQQTARNRQQRRQGGPCEEIGRASCRERV